MSFLLLSGLVLTIIPLIMMIGFAGFIFYMFMKDDPDSAGVVKVAGVVMAVGLILIAAHFLQNYLS